ncbi:hypothetical protein BSKO_03380 [Bryopsis sp. KO-2023]|nr:hypothetical protein BSKO_03380 [Bryopsis sp. KO-2023]
MALRFISRTLAKGVVARRLVSAHPRPFRQHGALFHGRRPLHQASVLTLASRREIVTEAEVHVAEQLGAKLSMLDETLEALQAQLEVGEVGQEEDQYLLSKLVDEVKQEQQAWIEETQAMDKLLKGAANLDTSEEELISMTKQYDVMKRKVELFTGLLQERAREVGSLRSQLQDIKQMGEVKEMKQKVASSRGQMVVAGSAMAESETEAETETEVLVASTPGSAPVSAPASAPVSAPASAPGSAPVSVPASTPTSAPASSQAQGQGPGFGSDSRRPKDGAPKKQVSLLKPLLKILPEPGRDLGMEVPGVVIALVVMGAGQLLSLLWSGIKVKIPKNVRVGVEMAAFVGATSAAISVGTQVPL